MSDNVKIHLNRSLVARLIEIAKRRQMSIDKLIAEALDVAELEKRRN